MDPSTSPVQSTPGVQSVAGKDQQTSMQVPSLAQLADPNSPSISTPQMISGHPEQGPIQTGSSQAESNEDEIVQPARQEVSTRPVQQVAEVQEIEVKPSIPEVAVEKGVENVVEKSPDMEKPKIPDAVKAVGVTHSGPGIPVDENVFNVKGLPMTYEQAVVEEKLHPKLNDSKHWLSELVMYVWRKLDPSYGKTKGIKK